jgi:hypothetical protein
VRLVYEIIDHGCDGEQYFPGCGVAFTKWERAVTGIGPSALDAAADALEQFYLAECDALWAVPEADLDSLGGACLLSAEPSYDPDEVSDEWHHYVSIRWRFE